MKKWFVILSVLLLVICIGTLVFIGLDHRSSTAGINGPLTPEQQKIKDLVAQLGDDEWAKRFAATEELKQIGTPAQAFLVAAFTNRDEEIRTRSRLIARWILIPREAPQTKTWVESLVAQLESRGIKVEFTPAQLANIEAPAAPPADAQAQPLPDPAPALPPPLPDLGGAMGGGGGGGGMGGLGALGALGGGMPGLGGLMGGGGRRGGGGGGLGGMMGGLMQAIMQRRLQGGGGGAHNNIPPPDLSALSLDLTGGLGTRLTEASDGLRVTDVKPGSPASRAGLRVGDLLKVADGKPLTTLDDAKDSLGQVEAGRSVKLELNRKGEALDLDVRF